MHSSSTLTNNNRIEIADVLRGFAVMGITIIHFIERFSLYSFPEETCNFLIFTDRVIWDSVFFTFAGKAYCIFALLFGFSFFIQDNSQKEKGKDFRGRFAWRLVLLFFIACVNSTLFPGEILMLYALLGYVLIAVCRLSTSTVAVIAVILLLQPFEWGQIIYAHINPEYVINAHFDAPYWEIVNTAQKEGSFLELCKTTIWTGNVANMGWMVLYGRVTQTAALFMIGMIIARNNMFSYSEKNIKFWTKVLIIAITAFFPIYSLIAVIPDFISREEFLVPSTLILKSVSNIAFTAILFSGVILVYFQTKFGNILRLLAPYGRMSLTNYLSQSLIGGFLFYNWGLGLYKYTGITACFLIGIGVFLLQYFFCRWWLRSHHQGPLEWLWKKATWIKSEKA
jgi:Predicted membrane protein